MRHDMHEALLAGVVALGQRLQQLVVTSCTWKSGDVATSASNSNTSVWRQQLLQQACLAAGHEQLPAASGSLSLAI
jgi:hypothetical protein